VSHGSRFSAGPAADDHTARRIPGGAAKAAVLAALLLGGTANPLAAQTHTPADAAVQVDTRPGARPPLVATRLSSPIRLDGRVDEAAWMAIEPLPAVMHSPTFGGEPSERTEFRIVYDENYLYISVELADRTLARIRLERRGLDGFGMDLAASRVGSRYDPALGFLQRRDFTRFGDAVGWGWRAGKDSPVLRHRLALRGLSFFGNDGFTLESLEAGPEWTMERKSGRRWVASTSLREERVTRPFAFAGASVPAGDYRWVEGRLAHTQPGSALLRGTLTVEGGRFYDGHRIGFSVAPTWSASRHLELNGLYQVSRISFAGRPSGEEQVLVQVARLRTRVMFSGALSTAFFVQYTSAADLVTLNARLRYNRREGQDFYLVFNDGLNTDRAAFDPGLPLSAGRTLLLKYSHAVPFGW
jgi:hypothetical protein